MTSKGKVTEDSTSAPKIVKEETINSKGIKILNKFSKIYSQEQLVKLEQTVAESSTSNDEYSWKIVKCVENLGSEYVKSKIKSGEWKIEEIVNFERETLNPIKWQTLQDIRLPKNIKKERVKGTNMCPRCRSWYTSYKQAQTRSGDEGLTTRCHCEDCEYHWKF
jgi:DNA-directed RNA polymerase subunit M/transcription elongation factor TFIIS